MASLSGAILGIIALFLTAIAAAETPAIPSSHLAARLSDAPTAMEYWDLTGQFRSGHRLFARFMITNEGPGSHTGVAVGHVILPSGEITPIKWGRTADDWNVSPDGRRLKIGKAVLDMRTAATVLDVNTEKHGIKIHIDFPRLGAPISIEPAPGTYSLEVVTPVPASGSLWLRGMAAPVALEGTMALTHSWMERSESEILQQHHELLAATANGEIYVSQMAFRDGRRHTAVVVTRAGELLYREDNAPLTWVGTKPLPGDNRYPVAAVWEIRSADLQLAASLRREWLRWNPLDIIPAPFRWIIGMKAQPQRIWAEADITLDVPAKREQKALALRSTGIAAVTFGQPVAP